MSILTTDGVELVERVIPGVGMLRFENNPPGTWLTQKGEPAKRGRRRYLLDGEEMDSVSAVTGTLDKPALLRWYENEGLVGGAQAAYAGVLEGHPVEDWPDLCRMLGYGPSGTASAAADRGKAIHVGMDTMARTGEPPNALDYPEAWRPWLRACARAWLSLDPSLVEGESILCNPPHGYAGRFDFYGMCHGVRTLLDWKSGKGKVYDSAHYSTRGYAECFAPCGLEPPDRIVIVGIADDGKFEPIECEVSADDWYDVVRVFRSRRRTNAGTALQRKAARRAA